MQDTTLSWARQQSLLGNMFRTRVVSQRRQKNQAETRSEETLGDDWNKGGNVSARGQEDELAADRGTTGTISTHIHKHQVKVIRAED